MHLPLPWRRVVPFTAADGLPILLYHKVGPYRPGGALKAHYVAPALFRAHLSFLAGVGYQALGVGDIMRYLRGEDIGVERPLVITFDDGYDCIHAHAFPALREFGFKALVFVVAGRIGGVNDWEPRASLAPEPMLTAEHIAEMARAGIEFGSHGNHHQRMTRLEPGQLRQELVVSQQVLHEITGGQVSALAYPYGDHNDRVRAAAAEVGYLAGFTTERGVIRPGADPLALGRINVRRYNYLPLFRLKLRRAYGMPRPRRG